MYLSETGLFREGSQPPAGTKQDMRDRAAEDVSPEPVERKPAERITGVILAGGQSRRMGRNKALLDMGGICLIEQSFQVLANLFHEVVLITNTPDEYAFLNCRCLPDIYPGVGSIAGLHSALHNSATERIFVVPCDMPFLNSSLISLLCQSDPAYDAVVPLGPRGAEPLHALYHRRCLPHLEQALRVGDKKIRNFLENIQTLYISLSDYRHIPDAELSFRNINRPEDYAALNLSRSGGNAAITKDAGRMAAKPSRQTTGE